MKTLTQDISLTLLIKFTLLILLWLICFHHSKLPPHLEKQALAAVPSSGLFSKRQTRYAQTSDVLKNKPLDGMAAKAEKQFFPFTAKTIKLASANSNSLLISR